MSGLLSHPILGYIHGRRVTKDLIQFRNLPYACIPRRFARAQLRNHLPRDTANPNEPYNAVDYRSCSIQSLDSIATDLRWNQLPENPGREQAQSEDCLSLTITCPAAILDQASNSHSWPVVAFIHGGALMMGSGDRKYYDPITFCAETLYVAAPVVFVSVNYRLGALGFLHCPEAEDYLPSNNGLYDQILAFEWLHAYIHGFNGDPHNITAVGQSAGAASLALHNAGFRSEPLYQKSVSLSGSTTVLVTMTPEEHHNEFLYQAKKLGIHTRDRSMRDIAIEVADSSTEAIRGLNYCGAPCCPSELIPESDWATMLHARHTKPNAWLESQIICSSTYDGSMSHLVAMGQERRELARVFTAACRAKLKEPQFLLDMYHISEDDDDVIALERICQAVTDVGFYGAAVSGLFGTSQSPTTRNYLILFDIGNAFTELLEKGRFATHTWDVVSLLGGYNDLVPEDLRKGISEWRRMILRYCHTGQLSCETWRPLFQSAMLVQKDGIQRLDHKLLAQSRAQKILHFAEREGGEGGCDLLWEEVIRFFLKTGNPRYSHEASAIVDEHCPKH